jgi:mannose-6-phosphate isomerase-like protein (cupin superfamily)
MSEEIVKGPGYAVSSLDALGEGYGFRKIRKELGVTAFGVNAIVLPPDYTTGWHLHEEQEELYICIEGPMTIEFQDGGHGPLTLESGDVAWAAPEAVRRTGNPGPHDVKFICVGGKDGYVGRDGKLPDDESP